MDQQLTPSMETTEESSTVQQQVTGRRGNGQRRGPEPHSDTHTMINGAGVPERSADLHTRTPADLRPTPASPGLWIAAVPSPRASYACTCGHVEHAAGAADVRLLVARHQEHRDHCPRTGPTAAPPAGQPMENAPRTGSHIRAIQGKIVTDGVERAA